MTPPWIRVATLEDFRGGRQLARQVGELQLLVVRTGGECLVIEDRCTHLGKSLLGGRLMAGQITCPFHGACFDLKTGAAVSGPAVSPLRLFPVRMDGETIYADLDPSRGRTED